MSIETLRQFLGWCLVFNLGFLALWALMFTFMRSFIYDFHSKMFKITPEHFDAIHYAGIAYLKITVFVLNLAPYIALHLVK